MKQQPANEFEAALHKLERKQRNSGVIYAFIPIAVICIGLLFFWNKLYQKEKELERKTAELNTATVQKMSAIAVLSKNIETQKDSLAREKIKVDSAYAVVLLLTNTLITKKVTDEVKEILEKANTAQKEIVQVQQKISASPSTGVTVVYYERKADKNIIASALPKLGVQYKVEKPKMSLSDLPSNYIAYGSMVNKEYVQMIAYALMKEGVEIKEISPLKSSSKANMIEIGCKRSLNHKDALVIDQIKNFKKE